MAAKPNALAHLPAELRQPFGPYVGAIDAPPHDGDTVNVVFDLGLREYPVVAVRINGVRAPELSQTGGPETQNYLAQMCPPGTYVIVQTDGMDTSERWSFDRVIGTLWKDGVTNVNEAITAFVESRGYPKGR